MTPPINLEITYRKGDALAGYLYLQQRPLNESTRRSEPREGGTVLDFVNDQLIGIEILNFNEEVVAQIETVLVENQIPFESSDLAPILRALTSSPP